MKRRLVEDGLDVSFEWDSYEDFLVDLQTLREKDRTFYNNTAGMGGGSGMSWFGTNGGFHAVMDKVQNGWPELRQLMMAKLEGLELAVPVFPSMTHTRRRKRKWQDQGDSLDQQRVWAGQIDRAWQRPVKVEKLMPNTRRITLAFDVTANGSVSNDMAMWRGALCMLLVDSLARAGRTFEIYVIDSTSMPFIGNAPRRLWSSWLVKGSAEPIVPDRLAAMVSVGFMRTSGFMAEGMGPWPVSYGYGGALNAGLPDQLRKRQKNGEVVLRIGECYNRQAVLREYEAAWQRIEAAADEAA